MIFLCGEPPAETSPSRCVCRQPRLVLARRARLRCSTRFLVAAHSRLASTPTARGPASSWFIAVVRGSRCGWFPAPSRSWRPTPPFRSTRHAEQGRQDHLGALPRTARRITARWHSVETGDKKARHGDALRYQHRPRDCPEDGCGNNTIPTGTIGSFGVSAAIQTTRPRLSRSSDQPQRHCDAVPAQPWRSRLGGGSGLERGW